MPSSSLSQTPEPEKQHCNSAAAALDAEAWTLGDEAQHLAAEALRRLETADTTEEATVNSAAVAARERYEELLILAQAESARIVREEKYLRALWQAPFILALPLIIHGPLKRQLIGAALLPLLYGLYTVYFFQWMVRRYRLVPAAKEIAERADIRAVGVLVHAYRFSGDAKDHDLLRPVLTDLLNALAGLSPAEAAAYFSPHQRTQLRQLALSLPRTPENFSLSLSVIHALTTLGGKEERQALQKLSNSFAQNSGYEAEQKAAAAPFPPSPH